MVIDVVGFFNNVLKQLYDPVLRFHLTHKEYLNVYTKWIMKKAIDLLCK